MSFPTEDQIFEARACLYVALVLAQPSDEVQIIDHVLRSLRLIGGEPPKGFDIAGHTAKVDALAALVAKHQAGGGR